MRLFSGGFTREYHVCLQRYGVALLGGDLSSARNDMVFSATVMGTGSKIITRSGAVPGDRIYVTSATGDAACGLEVLKRLAAESREAVNSGRNLQIPAGNDAHITGRV